MKKCVTFTERNTTKRRNIMKANEVKTGLRVVRAKGDYVVGRTGTITDVDAVRMRARVDWDSYPRTWVSFEVIEPESIPYTVTKGDYLPSTGKRVYPKYSRL